MPQYDATPATLASDLDFYSGDSSDSWRRASTLVLSNVSPEFKDRQTVGELRRLEALITAVWLRGRAVGLEEGERRQAAREDAQLRVSADARAKAALQWALDNWENLSADG